MGRGQAALVWMAVLAGGVVRVKMGDKEWLVADVVPILRLKAQEYAHQPPPPPTNPLLALVAFSLLSQIVHPPLPPPGCTLPSSRQ